MAADLHCIIQQPYFRFSTTPSPSVVYILYGCSLSILVAAQHTQTHSMPAIIHLWWSRRQLSLSPLKNCPSSFLLLFFHFLTTAPYYPPRRCLPSRRINSSHCVAAARRGFNVCHQMSSAADVFEFGTLVIRCIVYPCTSTHT